MSVKRYSVGVDGVDPNGNLVKYTDYAALEARCAALAAENAEMKEEISNITFMRDDDFFGSTQRAQEVMGRLVNIKTPATDAFQAELRAQGVEAFASVLEARGRHHDYVEIANAYAAQLRKGGEHEERQSFLSDENCQAFVKAFMKGSAK